ncbi:hypothetical protein NCAST_34_04805 [Nocardia asteroides NBRC 15531]|uniref:Uncharacterized protein n=1 Tax=Nocardia asteroides NBRC 15531 TaxID=1110697 RepID=U5EM01_NOCAS|nr:hypothetical protein NCAST_34_04805 [Nocardia asteroides NBRC 15531]
MGGVTLCGHTARTVDRPVCPVRWPIDVGYGQIYGTNVHIVLGGRATCGRDRRGRLRREPIPARRPGLRHADVPARGGHLRRVPHGARPALRAPARRAEFRRGCSAAAGRAHRVADAGRGRGCVCGATGSSRRGGRWSRPPGRADRQGQGVPISSTPTAPDWTRWPS